MKKALFDAREIAVAFLRESGEQLPMKDVVAGVVDGLKFSPSGTYPELEAAVENKQKFKLGLCGLLCHHENVGVTRVRVAGEKWPHTEYFWKIA